MKARACIDFCLVMGLALGAAPCAHAQTPKIFLAISPVKPGVGQLLIAVCSEQEFLRDCRHQYVVKLAENPQLFEIDDVEPGRWAAQIVYDVNGNGKMDTGWFGIPAEPVGFSRDAKGFMGPPVFADAAFDLTDDPVRLEIRLK